MTVRYFKPVLEPDAHRYLALGWQPVARDSKPSLSCDVIVMEWNGDNPREPRRE